MPKSFTLFVHAHLFSKCSRRLLKIALKTATSSVFGRTRLIVYARFSLISDESSFNASTSSELFSTLAAFSSIGPTL